MFLAGIGLVACGEKAPQPAAAAAAETASAPKGLSGTPPLDAQGVPHFRPGLYEVVQTSPDTAPETTRECMGDKANAEVRKMLLDPPKPGCKVSRSTGAGGLTYHAVCDQNGAQNTLKLNVLGNDTAYKMTLALGITPVPGGERVETVMTAHGRWIGACPAGMQPGDIVDEEEAS